jgi:hypothetical protein
MPIKTFLHEDVLQSDQEKTYVHLPFQVGAGATRLEVEYQYSDQIGSNPQLEGGNTLDLGVFDERGIEFLSAGFRGWSGSERACFFITENDASPGYLAGPLNPGTWHILLGLYKIAPQGCHYQVTIRITQADNLARPQYSAPSAGSQVSNQKDLPSSPPPGHFAPWLRGELHCHTYHSDGELSATELVRLSIERGLDFLAVADHNTIASQRELENFQDPGLILIRGVEATSFKGHFNIWGIPDWVDFRITQPEQMQAALDFARQRGALVSCNHPKPYGPDWDFRQVTNFDCLEVWNGPWFLFNQQALDYWLSLLESGRRIPAVAGSDFHRLSEIDQVIARAPGSPVNWVHVPGKQDAHNILQAFAAGHVSLSDEPGGPFLDLRAGKEGKTMQGDLLVNPPGEKLPIQLHCLRGVGGNMRIMDQQGVRLEWTLTQNDETVLADMDVENCLYLRAELRFDEEQIKAMTNPIYLQR